MRGGSACLGQAKALLALEHAQQLVQEALLQQKQQQQQRRDSHAAASTSSGSAAEEEPTAAEAHMPSIDAAGWRRVWREAEQAQQHWRDAGGLADQSATGMQPTAEQLQEMLALQGRGGDALCHILLPGSEAEPGQAAAALQQAAEELAANGARGPATALQRVALHRQAAEQLAAGGQLVAALFQASEAHRLAGAAFHAEDGAEASSLGWWRLAGGYAGSLVQLGQLFELAGLPDEALQAVREGHRLVSCCLPGCI